MNSTAHIKANGVHYTPPELAGFLARVTAAALERKNGSIEILDPACGDGGLLLAFAQAVNPRIRARLVLVGYETDAAALRQAERTLSRVSVQAVDLRAQDFLFSETNGCRSQGRDSSLITDSALPVRQFDGIIANPPYVRTQVLGAARAQALARRFGLTGRVDLYQAFIQAMAAALVPNGVLGLLTSNRFLFTQSGAAIRRLLRTQFDLKAIYDLGDTRLFSAAVLPVIVVAQKARPRANRECLFERVFECRAAAESNCVAREFPSVLNALTSKARGTVRTPAGLYSIERGHLSRANDTAAAWSLTNPPTERWLAAIDAQRACSFGDVGNIRVGIKTTADAVFIRSDWDELPAALRPEPEFLRPLIRHFHAARWSIDPITLGPERVLYPYMLSQATRKPIELEAHPGVRSYVESQRAPLTKRSYVIDAGRRWYEIWVPQNPQDWAQPKIVFPDIAREPRFFLDTSGAIVNGDCYWITLKLDCDPDWLYLLLAVANSSFITMYYDKVFHNKLYAGRRRFMTQYVKQFPLPALGSAAGRRLVALVSGIIDRAATRADLAKTEELIDQLVWKAFGLK